MTTYIALLRGINVGGANRKIRMADLRTILAGASCREVTTYIQSGNVVLGSEERPAGELRDAVESAILAATGLEVPVMLRTAAEWSAVVDANPFPGVDPTRLHVAFFHQAPPPEAAAVLEAAAGPSEEAVVAGCEIYMHLPGGMGRAKLPDALSRLGAPATVRNWRTVTKLLALSQE